MIYAQETTTTTTLPPDPERPLTDFVIDLFDLPPGSATAGLLGRIIEPVLQILLILIIAWVVTRLLRRVVRTVVARLRSRGAPGVLESRLSEGGISVSTRRMQRLDALGTVAASAVGFVIWTLAFLIILGTTFGLDLGPLLAGAGIVGVAIGFGAQDLVKDVISGLFLLAEDQYGVGDIVDVGEAIGVVEGISLRTTRIRDVTGALWHVPNGSIQRVNNMSQEWSRALLDIRITYGSNIDEAAEVIKGAADTMAAEDTYRDLFLAAPEIWGVEELALDAVLIRLVIKTRPGEQWAITRELRRRIKMAMTDAAIEIPIPQQTVWLRPDGPAEPGPTAPRDASAPSAATGKAAAEEGATVTTDETSTDQST